MTPRRSSRENPDFSSAEISGNQMPQWQPNVYIARSKDRRTVKSALANAENVEDIIDFSLTSVLMTQEKGAVELYTPLHDRPKKAADQASAISNTVFGKTLLRPSRYRITPSFPSEDEQAKIFFAVAEIPPDRKPYAGSAAAERRFVFKDTLSLVSQIDVPLEENNLSPDQLALKEVREHLSDKESNKRLSVLNYLSKVMDLSPKEKRAIEVAQNSPNAIAINNLYSSIITRLFNENAGATRRAFFRAVDYSNFEEEISDEQTAGNFFASATRFFEALNSTGNLDDGFFEIAKKNKVLKPLVEKIENFLRGLTGQNAEIAGNPFHTKKHYKNVRSLSESDAETVAEIFCKSMAVDKDRLFGANGMLERVDSFISQIISEGVRPLIGNAQLDNSLQQNNEVKGSSEDTLRRLVVYSFPFKSPAEEETESWREAYRIDEDRAEVDKNLVEKNPLTAEQGAKSELIFSARRKLILAILMLELYEEYDKIIRKGNQPIKDIWSKVLTGPVLKYDLYDVVDENGNLVDIIAGKEAMSADYAEDLKEKGWKAVKTGQPELRTFRGKLGEDYAHDYAVMIDDQDKSFESVVRKSLILGRGVHDIFRRMVCIEPVTPEARHKALSQKTVSMDLHDYDANGNLISLGPCEITDYDVVVDLMMTFQKSHPNVRIMKHKPADIAGGKMKSSGPGGGGEIIMSKFYFAYEKDGQICEEEVQVFLPTPNGHSALMNMQLAKNDHLRYDIDRLAKEGYLARLFPPSIYPSLYRIKELWKEYKEK